MKDHSCSRHYRNAKVHYHSKQITEKIVPAETDHIAKQYSKVCDEFAILVATVANSKGSHLIQMLTLVFCILIMTFLVLALLSKNKITII